MSVNGGSSEGRLHKRNLGTYIHHLFTMKSYLISLFPQTTDLKGSQTMDDIKARIQQTVDGLSEKKQILEHHKKQYIDLKFKLYDYEQYTDHHPELTVQMTSKARVKAQVIDPQQILVSLGAEYFVERDPSTAVNVVENKLKYLQVAIDEFDTKIKEAKKTLNNIDTLVEYQDKEDNDKIIKASENKPAGVELNEESLPFMEIREELDEDGTVISAKVELQNQDRLKEFSEQHGVELVHDDDELKELLKDMEITPRHKTVKEPKIQELTEPEAKHPDNAVEETIVERTIEPPSQRETSDFFTLFKEMGIVNKSSKSEASQKPEPTTTINATEIHDPENILSELDKFDPSQPAIEEEDIMQLQLIADEMDEDGYEYGFDEDDSDDQDQDDDEEEEEWDEYDDWDMGPENMVPDSYKELFAKELERIRGTTSSVDGAETTSSIDKVETSKKKKKSVSFDPELQIKEIENVSEQLKEAEKSQMKVSKFRQMKGNSNVSRDIQENEDDKPLNDIVEKEPIISDLVDNTPVASKVIESIPIMNDIVERNIIQEATEPQPPKRVSKFKSSMSSLNPTKAKASTIIESELVPIRQKIDSTPQRLSKFKSSRSTEQPTTSIDHIPVSISTPINTFESTPETEYNNIKSYALDDDEDEDLLNSITENMVVFNPDDEEFQDSEDEEEDSEDEGPMMFDNIVENDDVDEPSYFVDDNILAKEYHDLRKKMIETYGEKQREAEERIILKEEEGQELEPIDEYGNPVKVSRFRKGMKKA